MKKLCHSILDLAQWKVQVFVEIVGVRKFTFIMVGFVNYVVMNKCEKRKCEKRKRKRNKNKKMTSSIIR